MVLMAESLFSWMIFTLGLLAVKQFEDFFSYMQAEPELWKLLFPFELWWSIAETFHILMEILEGE